MAKVSSIAKNLRRKKLILKYAARRKELKSKVYDKTSPMADRFAAAVALDKLPRDSSATRYRNRCEITGRPRGYYRKFRMSRICLRDLANQGLVNGVTKSSW